jgi:hypothetical protein
VLLREGTNIRDTDDSRAAGLTERGVEELGVEHFVATRGTVRLTARQDPPTWDPGQEVA